jgi:ubiquinone/menaquinone biosynthesis C-methylase UbiE
MNSQTNDNIIRSRICPYCYLCGTPGEYVYQGLEDRLFGAPGEWNLKRCPNSECGLVWLDPMPIEEDIGKAYRFYYTHQGNSADYRDTGLKALVRSGLRVVYDLLLLATFNQKKRKRRNLMYLNETAPGKLLEVGCGDGSWLTRMRLLGWEVEGQEVDPKAAQNARSDHRLKVHLGTLEDSRIPDNTFDAITMNHVIEHVYDPVKLLSECRRILKPKGILVAITPNTKSLGHRYFGACWRGLEPPRHLHLFSQKTLKRVTKNAGFSQCKTWTTSIKAGVIALGSFDLKRNDHLKIGKPTKLKMDIVTAFYHLCAGIYYLVENDSGEECVLIIQKKV